MFQKNKKKTEPSVLTFFFFFFLVSQKAGIDRRSSRFENKIKDMTIYWAARTDLTPGQD